MPRQFEEGGEEVSLEVLSGGLEIDAVVRIEKDCEGPLGHSVIGDRPEMVAGRY